EGIEGTGELLAAAAHVRRVGGAEAHLGAGGDLRARLGDRAVAHEHVARHDETPGALAARDQPAPDEEEVDAHARHPWRRPTRTALRRSAPVFRRWMSCTRRRLGRLPSAARSSACPPTMPASPAAAATSATAPRARAGGTPRAPAITRNASVRSASPTRIASPSPHTLWLVGWPRRRSSSSIAGRSSCTSE